MPATTPNLGLPYPVGTDPIDPATDIQTLAEALDTADLYVKLAGDTMTGELIGTKVTMSGLVRGQSVSADSAAGSISGAYINASLDVIAGGDGRFSGQVSSYATAPTQPEHLVRKDYCDGNAGSGFDQAAADLLYVKLLGDTMTGSLIFNDAGGGGLIDVATAGGQLRLAVMGTTKFQIGGTGVSTRVPFFLAADPVDGFEAVTKQYCDANAGGTVDTVWVGPAAPVDPAIELWWDDDEPAPPTFSQADTDLLYVPLLGTSLAAPLAGTLWFNSGPGAASLVIKNADDTAHLAFHSAAGTEFGSLGWGGFGLRLTALGAGNISLYAAGKDQISISGTTGVIYLYGNTMFGSPPQASPFASGANIRADGVLISRGASGGTSNQLFIRGGAGATAVNQSYANFSYDAANTSTSGSIIGGILIASATTVQYKTTSDPRTKTPPPGTRGISNAVDRIRQLGAQAWVGQHLNANGQPDGRDFDLLSSWDIEDVAPYVVSGARDAVATQEDVDNNLAGEVGAPIYQMVGFADLVPLVIVALSQVIDRVTVLEGA